MSDQKFSLDAQLEEVRMAIDDYKYLPTKKVVSFRSSRLKAVLRTLAWVKENEASIRHWIAEQNNKNLAGELHNGAQH